MIQYFERFLKSMNYCVEAKHNDNCLKVVEELKDKLYESTKRYYQTERGKAKKAAQNRRYREKKKREREMMRNENI